MRSLLEVPPWLEVFCCAIAVCLGAYSITLLHEFGHLLIAKLCGWRLLRVKVGLGPLIGSLRWGDLRVTFHRLPFGGTTQAYPVRLDFLRTKLTLFALGGPLVTLAVAVFLVVTVNWHYPIWIRVSAMMLVLYSAILMFVCLVPHRVTLGGECVPNDGYMICQALWWNREATREQFQGAVIEVARILHERGDEERAMAHLKNGLAKFGEPGADAPAKDWIALLYETGADGRQRAFGPYVTELPALVISWAESVREQFAAQQAAYLQAEREGRISKVERIDGLATVALLWGYRDWFEEGLVQIEEAIQLAPEEVTLLGTKGSLLIELDRIDEGLILLDRVSSAEESLYDESFCRYYGALAYLKKKDRAYAEEFFRGAIKRFPLMPLRARIQKAFDDDLAEQKVV